MNRARLGKYSLWQFRDFVIERGIAIVIIGLLWGYLQIEPMRRVLGYSWDSIPPQAVTRVVTFLAGSIVSLSVLIALNGIISTDRKLGYYRFMFAKPLSPVRFYGQLFFVYLAGLIAAMLLLSGLFVFFAARFNVVNLVLYVILIYIALGGIGFFISAATKYDWVALAAVWVGARILRTVYGEKPDWRSKAVELLPPVHRVDEVSASLIAYGSAAATDVLWLAGYGALFFALGLFVLHRRSLAA